MCLFVFFLYAYYTDQNIIQLGCASQELLLLNLTLHRVPNIPIITNTTYIYISNFLTHKMCVYIYVGVCLCQCKKNMYRIYWYTIYTLFRISFWKTYPVYISYLSCGISGPPFPRLAGTTSIRGGMDLKLTVALGFYCDFSGGLMGINVILNGFNGVLWNVSFTPLNEYYWLYPLVVKRGWLEIAQWMGVSSWKNHHKPSI